MVYFRVLVNLCKIYQYRYLYYELLILILLLYICQILEKLWQKYIDFEKNNMETDFVSNFIFYFN